jgi:HEAT repeat protein
MNSHSVSLRSWFTTSLIAIAVAGNLTILGNAADYASTVQDLIPKLANANVRDRYDAQMQLQDLASQSSRPGHAAEREALGKVLAAKAADVTVPQPARVWIVRQLEYMGQAEAVPALNQLLNGDEAELRECARRALEKNPAGEAATCLRQALAKATDTAWKTGLLNSLGERMDAGAVTLISKCLADAALAGPAAAALGKIANASAIKVLWPEVNKNYAAGDALIEAANRQVKHGNASAAKAIVKKLYGLAQAPAQRSAALVVLAKIDSRGAWPLITEALSSHEPRLMQAGVTAAQNTGAKDWDVALAALVPKLDPAAKVQVLSCVGPRTESTVIKSAADPDETVRLAALEALGRMGSAAAVPVLLAAAREENRTVRTVVETALNRINGPGAAEALATAARSGEPKPRVAAINALALRQPPKLAPALLQYAAETDASVSGAAFTALGKVGADSEVEPLARLALASQNPEAFAALRSVSLRTENKTMAAQKVLALVGGNESVATKLLGVFSALGGSDSLALVTKLTTGSEADEAIRALGNWSSLASAEPLLTIASNPQTPAKQYQLALRGLAQVIETADAEPAARRAETAVAALNAARSVDDKKQIIPVLGGIPHPTIVSVIKPLLQDEQLKNEAGTAGINLARMLYATNKAAAVELAQAIREANLSADINRRASFILR